MQQNRNQHKDCDDNQEVSPKETFLILLGVFGIIPWAIIWVNCLAPIVGLGNLPIKGHLVFVLGIPAAIWWFFFPKNE
jgi:hypothetical protein